MFQAQFDSVRIPTGFGPEKSIDVFFAGERARWRSLFNRLAAQMRAFGDVSLEPGRTWIGFSRSGRMFALIEPAAGHLDVGLVCPGLPPAGRFRSAQGWNAMATHRIRLLTQDDDDELIEWLRDAHEAAGGSGSSDLRWSCD